MISPVLLRILAKIFFPLFIFSLLNLSVSAQTIFVSKTGSIKTISEAINLANDYDTLVIKSGEYSEGNIIVNKKLTIIGEDFPIIDGKGAGEVFTVTSDDVVISGLTIKKSGISYR